MRTAAFATAVIVIALGVPALQSCGYADPSIVSPAVAEDSSVMTIALDSSNPPFFGIDTNTGVIAGFEVDLLREIAKSGGFEVVFIMVSEYPAIAEAETDQTNAVLASLRSASEEDPGYECSLPYYRDGVICIKKGNEGLLALANRGIETLPEDTVVRLEKKWGLTGR